MSISPNIVAIHQPNFFPWLGYFDKILRCDCFVFLDNVQVPRTGAGSWVNRVNLFVGTSVHWFTMPISKRAGSTSTILETSLSADERAIKKLLRSLEHTYRKAPFYDETMALVQPLLTRPAANLADYNIHAITSLASCLGVPEDRFRRASTLPHDQETATDRLVRIVKEVGGTTYLYGAGAKAAGGYQEDEKFFAAGLALMAQNFVHPVYRQFNSPEFKPGLSVIDALMNLGVKGLLELFAERRP